MITSKEEAQLLKACGKNDRQAQKMLYDRYAGDMYAIVLRYSKNEDEAKDILQDAFIKVFNKLSSFRGDSALYHWIKRIVINTALNAHRNKHHLVPLMASHTDDMITDKDFGLSQFHLKDLIAMIQELPHGARVVFNLYAVEGYNHKEIADLLEISEGTSKSQYSRAKQLLQHRIKKEGKINYGTSG